MLREKRFARQRSIDPKEKERVIQEMVNHLSGRGDILFAYLHGSFVQDELFRDIDIAAYQSNYSSGQPVNVPRPKELFRESDLSYELSGITGYPVDVKIINGAPVAFQMSILRDGKLLFSHDEDVRTDFIEDVSKRYIEYAHLRNIIEAP